MRSSADPIAFTIPPIGFSLIPPVSTVQSQKVAEEEVERRIAEARDESYRLGLEQGMASVHAEVQEHRDALSLYQTGTLQNLVGQQEALVAQLRSILPQLATEMVKRVLAGFEPSAEQLTAIVSEVLAEIGPVAGAVEVRLSARDLALMEEIGGDVRLRHPGVTFIADPDLRPGDCRASSRFGAVDARIETKLQNVSRSLANE